jgi:sigma-B regulation protein RsbU (phosphoserine phosphatase)
LAAVRRYDVLDTPPDGAFDRITSMAARLFGVPIAIVSIVDHDRIWFKSHHGLATTEIGRDPGLCASAILDTGAYVVSDARNDPRTLANPLVAGEMGLQFYAAAPLTTSDGYNLGTVCVLDTSPREVTDEEMQTLRDLAAVVIDELELRRAAMTIHAQEQQSLDDAVRFASTLQESLLPATLPEIPGIELAAHFHAADPREVSGDFYDVFPIRTDVWGIALGDVAGKGPAAAAATSLVRYSLRTAALYASSPADVLSIVNRTMLASEYFGEGREPGYCTLVFAYLETIGVEPVLTICRAGHVRPIVIHGDGSVELGQAEGPLLGLLPDVSFSPASIALAPDSVVVFFTDGLTEARDGAGRVGDARFLDAIAHTNPAGAAAVIDEIHKLIRALGDGVDDDVAVLAVGSAR